MSDQHTLAKKFRALHQPGKPFIIPNPWDAGSARYLAARGFPALATTSAGFVFSRAMSEGSLTRDLVLTHASELVEASNLPVSADLEDCYAAAAEGVADTIRQAAATGLVGGSIEDARQGTSDPMYGFEEALDRVRAAVEGARSLPFPFTLTARCENYLFDRQDLADTIKRLQAYQDAGADVLYAPGLTRIEDVKSVVTSVDRPVNVVVGLPGTQFSVEELARAGVARISIGSALFRTAFTAVIQATDEMLATGTFTFAKTATGFGELNELFSS